MGKVMRVNCTSCHKEWKCKTGCGLSHALLRDVAREFSFETGREIMDLAGGEAFPAFLFAFHPAVCEECGNIVSVPLLELPDLRAVYTGSCPLCGGNAQPVKDWQNVPCPVCGERTMREDETGQWD